jgi:hypothetical protein
MLVFKCISRTHITSLCNTGSLYIPSLKNPQSHVPFKGWPNRGRKHGVIGG